MSAAIALMLKQINDNLEKHFIGNVESVRQPNLSIDIIKFDFQDWFTSTSQPRIIEHNIGGDPDEVIIFPSHYGWSNLPPEYYDSDVRIVAGVKRTWVAPASMYSKTCVDCYDIYSEAYDTILEDRPIIDWSSGWVRINPVDLIVWAPRSELTYTMLVIKHT